MEIFIFDSFQQILPFQHLKVAGFHGLDAASLFHVIFCFLGVRVGWGILPDR